MDKFNLKKYLAEGKLVKEFIGGELEKRNEVLYDKLVPGSGAADTVEGEMLRAINRIIYRYYNDGDKFYRGYGTETAGPAHSYLINKKSPISHILDKIFSGVVWKGGDKEYEEMLDKALEEILNYIGKIPSSQHEKNTEDMFNYESEFQDEEEDDDWGDDEDEDEDDY